MQAQQALLLSRYPAQIQNLTARCFYLLENSARKFVSKATVLQWILQ
jgi:hypothetical protein